MHPRTRYLCCLIRMLDFEWKIWRMGFVAVSAAPMDFKSQMFIVTCSVQAFRELGMAFEPRCVRRPPGC